MARMHYCILSLFLFLTAACSGTDTTVVSEGTETAETATTDTGAAAPTQPSRRSSIPETPKQPQYATVSAGTVVPVRLQDPLDTSVNQTGDTFRAIVDEDILIGNTTAVPKGSQVEGKVTFVERSGRVKGRAAISLQFVALHVGSETYPLNSEILSFEAEATKAEDAAKVGIGSGIGAAIGAIAGGGKGAAIGAAVGAGAGGATVAATRGKELKYEVEHPFEFTLTEDVRIPIR